MSLANRGYRPKKTRQSHSQRLHPPLSIGIDIGASSLKIAACSEGKQLIRKLIESPSQFAVGPLECLEAIVTAVREIEARFANYKLRAVGLAYPGPADRFGKIRPEGTVNSKNPAWGNFNLAKALGRKLGLTVVYDNDANAAGRWAAVKLYKGKKGRRIEGAIVGTGLGGFYVRDGIVEQGAGGKAAEYGHLFIPWVGIVEGKQPIPTCNCKRVSDTEAYASRSGLENWIAPWFLKKAKGHPLKKHLGKSTLAAEVRKMASEGDPVARAMIRQQAVAVANLFNQLIQVHDPDTLVVGGGILEYVSAEFRDWFMNEVESHLVLDADQEKYVKLLIMPDGDQAAARGMSVMAEQSV